MIGEIQLPLRLPRRITPVIGIAQPYGNLVLAAVIPRLRKIHRKRKVAAYVFLLHSAVQIHPCPAHCCVKIQAHLLLLHRRGQHKPFPVPHHSLVVAHAAGIFPDAIIDAMRQIHPGRLHTVKPALRQFPAEKLPVPVEIVYAPPASRDHIIPCCRKTMLFHLSPCLLFPSPCFACCFSRRSRKCTLSSPCFALSIPDRTPSVNRRCPFPSSPLAAFLLLTNSVFYDIVYINPHRVFWRRILDRSRRGDKGHTDSRVHCRAAVFPPY